MATVESDVTISEWVARDARNGAAPDDSLASSESQQHERKWLSVIDQLLGWLTNPEAVEDPELEPLSRDLVQSALDFAYDAQHAGLLPPSAFGPSVDGGISFERRFDDTSLEHLEIVEIGLAEVTVIRSGQVLANYWLERDPQHRGWLRRDSPAA